MNLLAIAFGRIQDANDPAVNGVIEALILSAIDSALELPSLLLAHPTETLAWLAAGALTTRIALGPRPRFLRNRRR